VIVVSHRGPYRFQRNDDGTFTANRGAGGVVSALGPLLLDSGAGQPDSTWIAAAMNEVDADAAAAGATAGLGVDLELLDLDPREHRLHYDVVSNGVLWFLHHDLFDHVHRPRFDRRFRDAWDAYVGVNERFAGATDARAAEGDIVLVQDYQLSLVPAFLRRRRPDLRIVHFTHTPFCGPDAIRVLPDDVAAQLCESLAGGPSGFHTERWAASFDASARAVLSPSAEIVAPFAASLGPDPDALAAVADEPAARAAASALADRVGERLVILRTDRMEPSKNIPRGFAAFDRLLEARSGLRGRVVFVAMLYPSRETLPEYLANANEILQAVARVNDRWATSDWTPIVLDTRDDFARSVAGMQRYDVLFVNPVKDGLNLVAKEGPILNRRDGLVCLSREAGAYAELKEGVLPLHPFDIEQMAGALDDALAMPLDERAGRAKLVRDLAAARTSSHWLADLLAHA
jgi:trehalose 6-phosphate synthase